MKKFVIAGTLAAAVAVAGMALAQQPAQTTPASPAPKAAPKAKTTDTGDQPAKPARARAKTSESGGQAATRSGPRPQPPTVAAPPAAATALALGTVRIPAGVKADGKDLPAGTYQVRLTTDEAKPDAAGASATLERWAEFTKAGKVVGRELVTIIPATETKLVAKDTPPPAGGSRVDALKGGRYTRVWFNKAGTYYLVHLAHS